MTVRFNPPPGWPPVPPGWTPPPGWEPDPSWPPGPPGWPFWVDEEAAVPPKARRSRRAWVVLVAKFLAAVIGLVAGVGGTYLTFANGPHKPDMATWRKKADAVCDRSGGNLRSETTWAIVQLGQATRTLSRPGQTNPALTGLVQAFSNLAVRYSSMTADLRQVPRPSGRHLDIDTFVALSSETATIWSGFANGFALYQNGTLTLDQGRDMATKLQRLQNVVLPGWVRTARKLRLAQCVAIGFNPPPASGAASAGPSAAQQALIGRLRSTTLTACVPSQSVRPAGVVTAVNCQTVASGPGRAPIVLQFTDFDAMQRWIASYATGAGGAHCRDSNYAGPWQHAGTRLGSLVCKPDTDGTYLVAWTIDRANIGVVASAGDAWAIDRWWRNNANLVV